MPPYRLHPEDFVTSAFLVSGVEVTSNTFATTESSFSVEAIEMEPACGVSENNPTVGLGIGVGSSFSDKSGSYLGAPI